MLIEIKVHGNPGLYRSLQEQFESQSTRHRTWTGAARRLVSLHYKAERWGVAVGRWGGWDIIVDGRSLNAPVEPHDLFAEPTPEEARKEWCDPVRYIAEGLKRRHDYVTEATKND